MSIREELELDISSAEDSVGTIGFQLASIAAAFKVDLADALGVLTSVVVESADASAVSEAITEAVADTDATVEVEADAGDVTSMVDDALAAVDASIVAEVQADTAPAIEEISALEPPELIVTVEADTGPAAASIADLGSDAAAAGGSFDGLSTATKGFAVAAGLAGGNTSKLGSSIASTHPAAAALVGVTATLSAATSGFFESALNAQGGLERYNETLGVFADQVSTINVGNLDTSLSELNLSLGSSTTQVRNVISSFFQMGQAAGAVEGDIANSSEQLVALAARAVALNPALGSVGDAAEGLSRGLARGGRFAAQYGLSLTGAEIEARALADRLPGVTGPLTQYEKVAAGAAVATEKYGDTLQETIAEGTDNPIIQLRALSAEFKKATTEIGKPLVSPVLDLIRTAQPIFINFAQVLGSAIESVLPVVQTLLEAISPVVDALGTELKHAFDELGPPLAELAEALSPIISAFAELIPIVRPFIDGFAVLASGVASLVNVLGPLIDVLLAVKLAVFALNVALDANPIVLLGVAIAGVIGALHGFGDGASDATDQQKAFNESSVKNSTTLESLSGALGKTTAEFGKFIEESSAFSESNFVDGLDAIGISTEQLRKDLQDARGGINDFVATAIEAGQVTIEIDGVEQTADDVRGLDENLNDLLTTGDAVVTTNEDLVSAFNKQQVAEETLAQTTLDRLKRDGEVTQAQIDQATAITNLEGHTGSYQELLKLLTTDIDVVNAAIGEQTITLGESAQSWVNLSSAVLAGQVTLEDAQSVAEELGVPLEQVEGFINNVTTALDSFVQAGTSGLPKVGDAFKDLNDDQKVTLAEFRTNLDEQTAAIAEFPRTVGTLLGLGFDNLAQLAIERGPEFAQQLATEIQKGGPAIATATEESLEANKGAIAGYEEFLRTEAGPALLSATTDVAVGASAGFDTSLNFDGTTADKLGLAEQAILAKQPDLAAAAAFAGVSIEEAYNITMGIDTATQGKVGAAQLAIENGAPGISGAASTLGTDAATAFEGGADFKAGVAKNVQLGRLGFDITSTVLVPFAFIAGQDVGRAFDDGIALGIISHSSVVREAARFAVESAEAAARAAAQIASPSQVFADLGEQLSAGLALGIENNAPLVVNAANSVIADSASATIATGTGGGSQSTRVEVNGVQVSIEVHGADAQSARVAGQAAADGFISKLSERQVIVDTRIG